MCRQVSPRPQGIQVSAAVVWLTGLSGSGKSTVSRRIYEELKGRGHAVEHLDGDAVRALFPGIGFTRPERDQHIHRVGSIASNLQANGVFVVASFISPYEDARQFVRASCQIFIEVYVSTPLAECERRDARGLYARARRGEIRNFTGVSDPYEPPSHPDVEIDMSVLSVDQAVERVMAALDARTARA
jgi:adenylylsulfate kinase